MMKFGIETESMHLWFQNRKMDIYQFIDTAKECGYDGVVINTVRKKNQTKGLGALGRDDMEHVRKVGAYIRKKQMYVELDTRGTSFSHLKHMLLVADAIGAEILRTYLKSGSYSFGNLVGAFSKDELEAGAHDLQQIIPELEKHRIHLAIENHELETMDEIAAIVRRINSPWLGVLFDFGNPMNVWEEPIEGLKKAIPYMVSTHVKDNIVIKQEGLPMVSGCPLGEGKIPLKEMFQIVYRSSTMNRLNLEMCHPYASCFQRPLGTGGVHELRGAFEVGKPLIPDHVAKPLDYYLYEGDRLEEYLDMQLREMKASLAYMKKLWKQVSQ